MKNKNYNSVWLQVLSFIAVVSLIGFQGCTTDIADSEAGNTDIVSTSAFIKLPTSIADNGAHRGNANNDSKDEAENIYDFIRIHNHFASELVSGDGGSVKQVLDFYIGELPWDDIIKNGSMEWDSASLHVEAQYDKNEDLPYTATVENKDPNDFYKIEASFDGNKQYPRGWVYYFILHPEQSNLADSLQIFVKFEKNALFRKLDIKIDQHLLVSSGDEAQSFMYSWKEIDGIIHLSGSTYHPFLDSLIPGTKGYCYTYTAVVDEDDNLAIVNLGLPPADCEDTTLLFTEYGISNMYAQWFLNYEIKTLDDTSKALIATSYKDSLNIEEIYYYLTAKEIVTPMLGSLAASDTSVSAIQSYIANELPLIGDTLTILMVTSIMDSINFIQMLDSIKINEQYYLKYLLSFKSVVSSMTVAQMQLFLKLNYQYSKFTLQEPTVVDTMTVDDLLYFLKLNISISDPQTKKDFALLYWLLKLTQPVYFDKDGYVANGDVAPLKFTALSLIPCNRPVFVPKKVKNVKNLIIEEMNF